MYSVQNTFEGAAVDTTCELDFRIDEPYKWDDRPYEPRLLDTRRQTQVKFNDLSSGERVLMSFALCLYHANEPSSMVDFPRVLLFDEIDAPLHPSMTRSLLRTIQQTLVDKHKIEVILTTHSPSTVALAPDLSIYVMQKTGDARLQHTTKDNALSVLTSGVPTLSVNYENRRQVFVESKYDVQYYSGLYERCKSELHPEVSLVFIASAADGNCDQVRSIVNQLYAGGNRTVRGIVDWDLTNTREGATFVLGESERYSIDNFLLDPVLLGFLLIRENIVSSELLALPPGTRYVDLHGLSERNLQNIANAVVSRVATPKNASPERVAFRYLSEQQIFVPTWFARMQGHDLEKTLKDIFPELNRYRRESQLKMAIIEKILEDYRRMIPDSIVSVLRRLQDL